MTKEHLTSITKTRKSEINVLKFSILPIIFSMNPSPDNLHPSCHGGDHSKEINCLTLCLRRISTILFFLSHCCVIVMMYIVTRVSQDFAASVIYYYAILNVIGASFSLIECASCHRYLEPNGFSAPILLFAHH